MDGAEEGKRLHAAIDEIFFDDLHLGIAERVKKLLISLAQFTGPGLFDPS